MSMDTFLKQFQIKGGEHTHTKIGNEKLNVFGGSYSIPLENMNDFYTLYKKAVLINKTNMFLTEKQMDEGPILIDLDFRYHVEIEERQHTKKHITDLVVCILDGIRKIKLDAGKTVECYIMEKNNVNMQEDKTKDGIHIIINVKMDYTCKIILRNYLVKELKNIWNDLPITNSWEDVIDESVIKGYCNWQLYGSKKPGNEDYKLRYIFTGVVVDDVWEIKEKLVLVDWIIDNFENLTARNPNLVIMQNNPDIQVEYESTMNTRKKTVKSVKTLESSAFITKTPCRISNKEELDEYIDGLMSSLSYAEYRLQEAYNYVMILPVEFWGPNSYAKWIRVGWALKNTDARLFTTWVKFSSQSESFDYGTIVDMYEQWIGFNKNTDGLTLRSIIYWCKESNESEYRKIYKNTISHFVKYSFIHNTDYDLAIILYHMYKDLFVCANPKQKIWYEFCNHHWEMIEDGCSLRSKISTEMFKIYTDLTNEGVKMIANEHNEQLKPETFHQQKKNVNSAGITADILKNTARKNNIMREAIDIFHDKDFYGKLNTNNYLLGCNNYVIDFKAKEHRRGRHDDYISLSTKIDYRPISEYRRLCPEVIEEINIFMSQLFPNDNIKKYMWQHLASTLLGNNTNQTFNIYIGTGKNGKSKLVEFMTKVLGDYKATVPITLITQKRTGIGSTSSEICQLVGTRYAVMQEPTKGDVINEGIMKEITGSDPIQCRALFKESITFIPQFKLAVCANNLFEFKSNDDGTWRRIRLVPFDSKFTENPYNDPQFPNDMYPHQFPVDEKLEEKFEKWAPVMLSMLTEIAYELQGKVYDCEEVKVASEKYRQKQDIYMEFINLCFKIHETPQPNKLKITVINDAFKNWFMANHGGNGKTVPIKDLKEYLIKKFGPYPKDGWSKLSLEEIES